MTMSARARAALGVLVPLALALAGCGDDKGTAPETPWPPAGFPSTPDQLVANFRYAYETMDAAALLGLLRADHLTILQASTTTQFPTVGSVLDMTEEARIAGRMFSGQDLVDPEGSLVPAVHSITFQTLARQTTWTLSAHDDMIPDTPYALYNVVVLFDRGQNYSIMRVQGALRLYAAARDSTHGDQTLPYYQLRGQLDMTQNLAAAKDIESFAWGTVKAIFR